MGLNPSSDGGLFFAPFDPDKCQITMIIISQMDMEVLLHVLVCYYTHDRKLRSDHGLTRAINQAASLLDG